MTRTDNRIPERTREQTVFWLLVVLVGGIMLFGLVAPRTWKLYSLRREISALDGRKQVLEAKTRRLRLTLQALKKGRPEVWRLYVRERLRFVEKGYVPVLD